MLSLPQELILSILEYTGNDFRSFEFYIQHKLKDIFNLWLTCKHFDYLKDKYYTIKISRGHDVKISTFKLLNRDKLYGYEYEFSEKTYLPRTLFYCSYKNNGDHLSIINFFR